jgi:hypothetical protein
VQDHLLQRQLLRRLQRRSDVLVRGHGLQRDAVSVSSYYGLPIRDEKAIVDHTHTIDVSKLRAELEKTELRGDEHHMTWACDDAWVRVDILPSQVHVTLNDSRSSFQVGVLVSIIGALRNAGVHVYDPQQRAFLTPPRPDAAGTGPGRT